MEFGYPTILLVPFALGLLGFIEPCTVGGHLIVLRAFADRTRTQKTAAILIFVLVRILVMGGIGAAIAAVGQFVIAMQTTLWLIFGLVYLLIGALYALERQHLLRLPLNVGQTAGFSAAHPLVLGGVLGLNVPACAAPILFALLSLAAGSGAAALGFATMAVFALALSLPLAVLAVLPNHAGLIAVLRRRAALRRWGIAALFFGLGLWSVWFGLFVDPADWASL